MKFTHDGVEFEVEKPVVEGWEFNDYRRVRDREFYFNSWICKIELHGKHVHLEHPRWIATRKPVKPVVDGWAFLEDKPRIAKEDELYYLPDTNTVTTAIFKSECEYWIATLKIKPKVRKVVRYKIRPDGDQGLSIPRPSLFFQSESIDLLQRDPDFIGFLFEDGKILKNSIGYFDTEFEYYIDCAYQCDIESGKIEVRNATHAMFFE